VVFGRNGVPVETKSQKQQKQSAEGTGGSGGAGATRGQSDGAFVIRGVLNAPRNLWVRGNDLNVEVGFKEGFRFELAGEPIAFGEIDLLRGRMAVFGRKFDIERDSTVQLTGPVMNPRLNVTARHV